VADDDFEDEVTPERGGGTPVPVVDLPSGLTDSQRDWFAQRLASGVPSVKTHPTPPPHALLARTTTHDELELLRHFRLAGDSTALAEFAVKLYAELRKIRHDLNAKIESDSSQNERDMEALRALLSKPPNGRMAALQDRVASLEKVDTTADARLKQLEGDAKFARRAAQGVIVFVLVSAGGFLWWFQQRAEAAGAERQRLEYVIDAVKDLDRKVDRLPRWTQPKDPSP